MKSMNQVCDLLRPGLWGMAGKFDPAGKLKLDLSYEFAPDTICLHVAERIHILFTRAEIEDDSFKQKFAPRVTEILEKANAASAS
jgi:hypothetical protein